MPRDTPTPEPVPRRPTRRAFAWHALGAAALIGGLSVLAQETAPSLPGPAASVSEPSRGVGPSLAPPDRPAPALQVATRLRLDMPGEEPGRPEPARLAASGTSEAAIARGDFTDLTTAHLRLTLAEGAADPPPGLFVTLVRRAAEGMLAVVRTGARDRIDTKFGPVETLEATLSGPTQRICTGFATPDSLPVRLDGWLCAPLGQPPEPRTLACTLDALSLEAGAAPAAQAAFAQAERRRDPGCAPPRPSAAAEPQRTGAIAPRRATRKGPRD